PVLLEFLEPFLLRAYLRHERAPVRDLIGAHRARPDECTPAAEDNVNALLPPRGRLSERSRQPRGSRNAEHSQPTRLNVRADEPRRRDRKLDMAAEYRRERLAARIEYRDLESFRIGADRFADEAHCNMIRVAERCR